MTMTTTATTSTTTSGVDISNDRTKRALATVVIAQPALLALNALFHPEVEMTGPSILAGALESPETWYAVHVVAAVGALLAPAAAYAIRTLVPGRGRSLATTGLVLTAIGAMILSFTFAIEASLLHLVATDLHAEAALAVADAYVSRPEFYAVGLGVAAATIGAFLLGVALLRSRTVPRWQPLLYIVGVLATMVGAPGTAIGPLGFATVTVASGFLARSVYAKHRWM
jgi:hypothetical protein